MRQPADDRAERHPFGDAGRPADAPRHPFGQPDGLRNSDCADPDRADADRADADCGYPDDSACAGSDGDCYAGPPGGERGL